MSPTQTSEAPPPAAGALDADEAVRRYLPLVLKIASKMKPSDRSLEYEDYVQEGLIALWRIAPKYDPSKGIKFEAFAAKRIRGAMLDAAREFGCYSRTHFAKIRAAQGEVPWDVSLDQPPTDDFDRSSARWQQDRTAAPPWEPLQRADAVELLVRLAGPYLGKLVRMRLAGKTFKEIGAAYGLSESRVSQIHSAMLRKLGRRGIRDRADEFAEVREVRA